MKRVLLFPFVLFAFQGTFGQLSGTYSIPGDYTTIAAAVTDLNSLGISSTVTFNVDAGHTESVTAPILLTATGTETSSIIFQKSGSGANPLVTRTDAGTLTTSVIGGQGDGIIIIQGSDYVTFDSIDLAASQQGIEYGYFLRKVDGTDACKHVAIKNATITMTKGSSLRVIGIYSSNLVSSSPVNNATGVTVTTEDGRHEYITITGNTISSVFYGMYLRGYQAASPFNLYDQNFTVGTSGQGNTIQNFGGGAADAFGILAQYHNNININYNNINNTAGGGTAFTRWGLGIQLSDGGNPSATCNNNQITLSSTTSSSSYHLAGIRFYSTNSTGTGDIACNNNTISLTNGNCPASCITFTGTSNSFTANNNTFSNCTSTSNAYTTYLINVTGNTNNITASGNQTSGTISHSGNGISYGYYCSGTPTGGIETVTNNNFSNMTASGSGAIYGIYSSTSISQDRICSGNTLSKLTQSSTGNVYGIYAISSLSNQIHENTVDSLTAQRTIYGIYFTGTNATVYDNNLFHFVNSTAYHIYGISNEATGTTSCYNNQIYDFSAPYNGTTYIYGYYRAGSPASGTETIRSNSIHDLTSGGGTGSIIYGIYSNPSNAQDRICDSNYVSGLTHNNTGTVYGIYAGNSDSNQIHENTVDSLTAQRTIYGIYFTGTSPTVHDNDIFHLTNTYSSPIHGIYNASTGTTNCYDNQVYDFIAISTGAAPVYGYYRSNSPTGTETITGNSFTDFSADGTGAIYGIYTSTNTSYNRICSGNTLSRYTQNLSGAVYGIYALSSLSNQIHENVIDTLSGKAALYGICCTGVNPSIDSNQIFHLTTSGTTLNGIYNGGTGATDCDYNSVYDLVCSSAAASLTYGYYRAGTPTGGSETISNNSITNISSSGSGTSYLYGIYSNPANALQNRVCNANSVSGLVHNGTGYIYGLDVLSSISNDIYQNTIDSLVGGGQIYGLYFSGTNPTVYTNTIDTLLGVGAVYGLYNAGSNPVIHDNIISHLSSSGTTLAGLYVGTTGVTTNCYNNQVYDMTSTASSGNIYGYYRSTSGGDAETINNNSFTDITTQGTSTLYGIYSSIASTKNRTCINNSISDLTHNGTGTIYGINAISSSSNEISGNTIERVVSGGGIYGINFAGVTPTVYDNNIDTLSGAGSVYGVYMAGTTPTLHDNDIFHLSTSAATISGIHSAGTGTSNCYENTVRDISSTHSGPTVSGIMVAAGTANYNYNNYISDLRAPNSALDNSVRGINITSSTGNSTVGIYHNTIYLNASSSGSPFGSSGLYHTAYSTSTTAALDLRNNIIVNNSTPSGSGYTVAYRRSSTNLGNYSSVSNNNCFYGGTPGANHLVFYDGTTGYQNISDYQTIVAPRDSKSFRENPPFEDISATPYDLHLQTTTPTQCETGGVVISTPISITTDYDSDSRSTTYPDVGADEFTGITIDLFAPDISYTGLNKTYLTTNRPVSDIIITDPSGVNTTSGTRPRIYYKRYIDANQWNDNTNATDGWKYTEADGTASPFSFTIDYSLLYGSGVTGGDVIQYFFVAQDLASTPNVSINSGAFALNPTSVALTSAAFPVIGTINEYAILESIIGSVTVGTGGDYPSLTGIGGLFEDINNKSVTGNITATIISDITETGTNALNQFYEEGTGNYTLTIQPDGTTLRTISGTYSGGLIRLNGADRVTIDGRYGGSGNYLAISNTSTSSSTATVHVISLGTGAGATDVTIRNCNISAGSNSISGIYGIFAGGASIPTSQTGADNDSLTISSNVITKCYSGIWVSGVTTTGILEGLIISGNTIGSDDAENSIAYMGIYIQNAESAVISQNHIFNLNRSISGTLGGVTLGSYVTNSIVSNNMIHGFRSTYTGSAGCIGIYLSSGTGTSGITIYNNVIYDLINYGGGTSTTYNPFGIWIAGGDNHKVYYNSVNLYGSFLKTTSANISSAFIITSSTTGLDLRDNVFVNTMTGYTGSNCYAIYVPSGTIFGTIDYNDYYATGTYLGFYGTAKADLTAWRASSGGDLNSISADPDFQSDTDLRPGVYSPVPDTGIAITGITTDYLGELRDETEPTLGAYENAGDYVGPDIVYSPIPGTLSTSNPTFSNVTIVDSSGVNTSSGTKPRVYYKRSFDANEWNDNTSGTDGWKYVEANGTASPFDFTIDYSLLNGGTGVVQGDTVEYFVVAQDLNSPVYVSINSGVFAATPTSVELTSAAFPITGTINEYPIHVSFAGSIDVGTGETYTSLTADAPSGLFKAINDGELSGNLTVNIVSDLAETGAIALNQWAESGTGNYTLTIKPDAASMRTISGSFAGGLIRLNGADRVTIDGAYGRHDSYLTLKNTSTSANTAVIQLISLGTGAGASKNTIRNCNITGGSKTSSSAFGIFLGGANVSATGIGADNDTVSIASNEITKCYYGIFARGVSVTGLLDSLNISGNIIGSSNSDDQVTFHGIDIQNANAPVVSQNEIFNLQLNAGVNNAAIDLGQYVKSAVVSRNLIYGMRSTSTSGWGTYGINISSTTDSNINIINNVIYDLVTDGLASSTERNPYGIRIVGGINHKLYYNTVNLYGSLTDAAVASNSAALMITSNTATGIDLRDNIFVNTMTGGTTAKCYAVYVPAGTTFGTIDYNNYYVAGDNGVLGYYGADQATLADWQTASGGDVNSLNTDPLFQTNTDLRPVSSSTVLGAGTPISGISIDILGATRDGSNPSMGAYENGGDFVMPAISYTLMEDITSSSGRSFQNVSITDIGGVNTTPGTSPRVYYKRETDANSWNSNDNTTDGWKYVEANGTSSPFDFTIDYSKLNGGTGVAVDDVIQYFVVAQDLYSPANVAINSGTFAAPPSSVALDASAFPISGTINNYYILGSISGDVTVGYGGDYETLTGYGGLFEDINNKAVTGNIVATIISDIEETGEIGLNEFYEEGAGNYTLTIQPDGTIVRNIFGYSGDGLIRLYGADRVTFDGRFGGSGNYLAFANDNNYAAVFQIISLGSGAGACNNTIRNCYISAIGYGDYGIYVADEYISTVGAGADNDNVSIIDNAIYRCDYAVHAYGIPEVGILDNLIVTGNIIGSSNPNNYVQSKGIDIQSAAAPVISENEIYNIQGYESVCGIEVGQHVANALVDRNKIHSLVSTGGSDYGAYGIYISSGTGNSGITIQNNAISELSSDGGGASTTYNPFGIMISGGSGYKIYYNSVNMCGSFGNMGSPNYSSALLIADASVSGMEMLDNVFANTMTGASGSKCFAVYVPAGTTFSTIDYNDYYAGGSSGILGYYGSDITNLADWKTASGSDVHSQNADPVFQSNSDLRPGQTSPLLDAGTPITGITTDLLGDTRDGSTPTIGSYEIGGDFYGPMISYVPLSNSKVESSRSFTGISITDPSGVNTSSGFKPRVYYKRSTDANSYADNTNSTNGWKYTEASGTTSPFDFTIDYSKLYGGTGIETGATVQYFVTAQDLHSPVFVSINSGSFAVPPASVALTDTAFPVTGTGSYMIMDSISGEITVGTGGDYPSLTGVGGLFSSINNLLVTGNITATVISDLSETGSYPLYEMVEYPTGSNYTLTIKPDAAVTRNISGSYGGGLIRLHGADRVTFDGRFSGDGNYLSFTNTYTSSNTSSVFRLISLGIGAGAWGNTIRNCNIAAGTTDDSYGIYVAGTSLSSDGTGADNDNLTITGNIISKCNCGIYARGSSTEGLLNNLVINSNTLGSDTPSDFILTKGIDVQYAAAPVISQNEIFNIQGPYYVHGIDLGQYVADADVSSNWIHGLKSTATYGYDAYGINISSATGTSGISIYNNVIYDLSAYGGYTSTSSNPFGIRISGGTDHKVYYNSVNMYGAFTGSHSNISSAFIISSNNVTGTDLRNNIFVNSMTGATGTECYSVYVPSGTTFASINYNDYYASGTNGYLGYYGYDITTLAEWVTESAGDTNSLNENPYFQSDSDLRPGPGSAVLDAGTPVSGITTDFLGVTRDGTTPSMGAYELGDDFAGPSIDYTLLSNTNSTSNRTLENVTITDLSGVNTTSGTRPRIYYKRYTDANEWNDNTSTTNGWKYAETDETSSPFDFDIDYSLLYGGTGASNGNVIQYFIVAEDLYSTVHVGVNSGTFTTVPATVVLTSAAFPITGIINEYYILPSFSGTVNVGTGQAYTSLTGDNASGLFKAINLGELSGNLTVNIVSDLTETGEVALNQWMESGSGNYTLTIKPDGTTLRTISGNYPGGLIRLNGADRVTFDGSAGRGDNYLSFKNTSTSSNIAVFQIISLGTKMGATRNTIHNCNISAGINSSSVFGIYAGSNDISSTGTGADNDILTIADNVISKCGTAIYARGVASTGILDGLSISGNTIGSSDYTEYITYRGIDIQNAAAPLITQNEIFNMQGASTIAGIDIGQYVTNAVISRNQIHDLDMTSTFGAYGINISNGTGTSGITIHNNLIYNIFAYGGGVSTFNNPFGIRITGGNNHKLYYNSVNLSGEFTSTSNTHISSAFLITNTAATGTTLKDNIFANTMTGVTGTKCYAAYVPSGTYFTAIDHNDYYVSGANGILGYYGADKATLSEWQTASGGDNNSVTDYPCFQSDTDLRPCEASAIIGIGTPVSGIPTDIEWTSRNATNPSLGAYESGGDYIGPYISYTPLYATYLTTSQPQTEVIIVDSSGVNTTVGTRPRAYFKRLNDTNTFIDNTNTTQGWKYAESNGTSSPFDFTIDYSLLYGGGSASVGDTFQYFIVAQDLATPVNISINAGTFAAVPTSVNLTSAAFPIGGYINQYIILEDFPTNVTVGTGGDYPSLTGSGGLFETLNGKLITGNVNATIISDLTEDGTNGLNQLAEYPPESNFTLTVKPDGTTTRTISGAYDGGLIRLYGADYVIFDGRYGGSGNYLSFKNTTDYYYSAAFQVISLGTGAGATHNIIRNCNISTNYSFGYSYGIYAGSASLSTSGTGADNDNLTLLSNVITRCYIAIFARGVTTSGLLDNLEIEGNTIGSDNPSEYITYKGIDIQNATAPVISQNEIFNISGYSYVTGIDLGQYVSNAEVSSNTIHGLKSDYSNYSYAYGIHISSATGTSNISIYNNVIYDLVTYGYGINTFYNPFGIRISGGTNHKVYYNSVYLSGSFASLVNSSLSSAFIITTAGVTGTDLRDNVFVNTMTGATESKCYAMYLLEGTTFGTIDYNDYYAGGPNGILGCYGPDITTLAAWQAASGGDGNSLNADPCFQTETDLRPYLSSVVLAAGTPISGISTDILGETRDGSNPTMGAYENGGDFVGPQISYTPLSNTYSTSNRTFSDVTITDPSGVNNSSGTKPRVYYKRGTDANEWNSNSNTTDGWKYAEANGSTSPFDFTIDYSLLYGGTGVSSNDVVQYFVVAQDLYSTVRVSINSGSFASIPSSVNLGSSAFPIGGAIKEYVISVSLAGTVNVGSGQTYTSLTGDDQYGLFRAINNGNLSGNLTVNIVSNLTESGEIALNEWAETGRGSYTVTIQPNSSTLRTISGNYNGGLIRLNGADRVTFDGRYGGSGNYLSFVNSSPEIYTAVFQLISLGSGQGATYNTIRNCNVAGGDTSLYGIYVGSSIIDYYEVGPDNDNNSIISNVVTKCDMGIYASGNQYDGVLDNLVISDNTIGSTNPSEYIRECGIYVINVFGANVSGNEIFNIISDHWQQVGILVEETADHSRFSKNNIHTLGQTMYPYNYSYGFGMYLDLDESIDVQIDNNSISDIEVYSDYEYWPAAGIYLYDSYCTKLFYNSINIAGNTPDTLEESYSTCLFIDWSCYYMDVRNNIFSNTRTGNNNHSWTVFDNTGESFTTIDFNDYYTTGEYFGYFYYDNISNFTQWKSSTGQDQQSISDDPLFNSNTNLQPSTSSPVLDAGTPITGITTDILDVTRDGSTPSMGAYETGFSLITFTWLGYTTDWNSTGNWSTGEIPDETIAVVIPTSPTGGNHPVVSNGVNAKCYSFTLQTGATLNVETGGSMTVYKP